MMDWRVVLRQIATNHSQNPQNPEGWTSFEDIGKVLRPTIPPDKPHDHLRGWRDHMDRITINHPQNPQNDEAQHGLGSTEACLPPRMNVKDMVGSDQEGEQHAIDVGRVVLVQDMARRRWLAKIELTSLEEDGTWYCLQ